MRHDQCRSPVAPLTYTALCQPGHVVPVPAPYQTRFIIYTTLNVYRVLRIKRLTSKGQGHKVVLNVSVKMIAGLLAFVGTLRVAEGFIGMSPTRCSLGNSFIPPADAAAAAALSLIHI